MNIQQPIKQYKKTDGLAYSCQYYVMFCIKYRRKVLTEEMIAFLEEVFQNTAEENGFQIMEMNVLSDCTHFIISCDLDFGIMNCVKKLKTASSKMLKEEFPELKSRLPSIWTRSVFISSMGTVTMEEINNYYEEQKGR